jgi:hypothetical protein
MPLFLVFPSLNSNSVSSIVKQLLLTKSIYVFLLRVTKGINFPCNIYVLLKRNASKTKISFSFTDKIISINACINGSVNSNFYYNAFYVIYVREARVGTKSPVYKIIKPQNIFSCKQIIIYKCM